MRRSSFIRSSGLWLCVYVIFSLPAHAVGVTAVSPELIAALAMTSSDEAKSIANETSSKMAADLKTSAAFATKVDAKVTWLDNENEQLIQSGPATTKTQQLNLGIGKAFETGTYARLEMQSAKREFGDIPNFGDVDGYETSYSLSLRQSLWKNAFGRSISIQRKINSLAEGTTDLTAVDKLESSALTVVGVFYRAWQAQLNGRAAAERLTRQRRLLATTKLKADRGTAERTDLLQVEAALALGEERLADAKKLATDFWKQLAIGLSLPAKYVDMDAMTIPLTLGSILDDGRRVCKTEFPEDSPKVKSLQAAENAAALSLEAVNDSTRSDLYVEAKLNSNAIDKDLDPTLGDAAQWDHPQTAVVLGWEMQLSHPKEEADRLEALKQKTAAAIRLSQLRTQFRVDRDALCRDLDRFEEKVSTLKSVLEKQKQRERGEEDRFKLGKADTANVILAGNDVTDADFLLRAAEGDHYQTAWKLVYLSGKLTAYLEPFKQQLGAL
jgi:outer membrane protein TolC